VSGVPLARMYIDDEMRNAAMEVLNSGKWIKGQHSKLFANEFAEYCGAKAGVTCSNGSVALIAALRLLDVGVGDEVLVPSHTYIASATAINHVGAEPVFIEVGSDFTADSNSLLDAITSKTKAAIMVHLYGQPIQQEIVNILEKENIPLIEDCAQAHGAKLNGNSIGSLGALATFSFFPSKNMGVGGDGGMILTNREDLIEPMKIIVDHGRSTKYENIIFGTNWRMSEIQAAIGRVQLKHLPEWVEKRQVIAERFHQSFSGLQTIDLPIVRKNVEHAYHLFVIQVNNRNDFMKHLKENGVESGIHYPIPCHKQPVYSYHPQHTVDSLKNTEKLVHRIVSIPIHPLHTEEEIKRVINAVLSYSEER